MSVKQILSRTLITGLLAVLFIPFIVTDSQFFPFITGKAFTFRIGVEIIFALWVLLAVRERTFLPRFSWILVAVTAFVAIIGVADFFGINPYKSFWSNYERMEGFLTLIHVFMYFLVVSSVLNTEKLWRVFLNTSVIASIIMCFYGFLQLAGKMVINQGGVRLDGTMGNAIYLAVYMLFNIFFAVFLFVRSPRQNENDRNDRTRGRARDGGDFAWSRYLYLVAIALQTTILYNTASRGVILGLVGGAILTALIIAIFERQDKKVRKFAIGGLVVLAVLVGGFWLARGSDFVQKSPVLARFASLSPSEIKSQGRYFVWPMAIEGFKERPILGWGQEGFNYVFNEHYNPAMFNQESWFDRTHNAFLDWLIAGGLLGLLSYLAILAALVFYTLRSSLSVKEKAIFLGLIAGYIFQSIFVFDNLMGYIYLFSLLAFFHFDSTKSKAAIGWLNSVAENKNVAQMVLVPVVFLAMIFMIYTVNIKPLSANRTLLDAIASSRDQKLTAEVALANFNKALDLNTFGNPEIREQMFFNLNKFQADGVSSETRKAFQDEAVRQYEIQISETPNDTRYLLFFGSLLARLERFDDAVSVLEKALETSPKKQQIFFELGTAYINSGNPKAALEKLKMAYDSAPEFGEAKVMYAIGAIYAKDLKLADYLLADLEEREIASEERILIALSAVGEYSRAAEIIKKRIKIDPENPQHYFSLAAAYLRAGNRPAAISELRRVGEIIPATKNQADYYIKEIQAGRNP